MSETGEHDDERRRAAPARPPVDAHWFAAEWARVEGRLLSHLVRRRGMGEEAAADVCQEVALRAVLYRVQFRTRTDMLRWAMVVGNRVATAVLAEEGKLRTEPLPTSAEGDDAELAAGWTTLEDDAEARLAVRSALASASDADIQALRTLFQPGEPPVGKRDRDRLALQLHRARKRLRARLDDLLGALGLPGLARALAAPRHSVAARAAARAAVSATLAGAVLGGFTVSSADAPRDPHEAATGEQAPSSLSSPVLPAPDTPDATKPALAAHTFGKVARPPSATPTKGHRPPVAVAANAGKVTVEAEATTPAGTTRDVTIVTLECGWWVAWRVCALAP